MRHGIWSLQSLGSPGQLVRNGYRRKVLLLLCLLGAGLQLTQRSLYADSPPPIVTNIEWDEDPITAGNQRTFASVAVIEAAYNNARRQEEAQLGLAANVLGELDLPSDAQWSTLNVSQKALILINAERRARGNAGTAIHGLPLAGVDQRLTTVAQQYADLLLQTNTTGHLQDGSPVDRLNAIFSDPVTNPASACREFVPYTEAIAAFWSTVTGSLSATLEQAVYSWLYRDAGSSWGHRATLLMQDTQTTNQGTGYHNNVGSDQHEGLLGIGYAAGANYDPLGWGWPKWGEVIVLNIIDPSTNPGCAATASESGLLVSKKVTTPLTESAGEVITVTFTLRNTGSTLLTGIQLTDTVNSTAFNYLSATVMPGTFNTATGQAVWRDLEQIESDGTLDPTEAVTFAVRLMTTNVPFSHSSQTPQATAYGGWHSLIRATEQQRALAARLYLPVIIR